mmetsp:Transcript_12402/g.10992  ORF Transcript_12402/g.10992 Transcript_12402/m.10992 type:complete len:183 (-) Transcript_12402:42-590(-)
MKRIPDMREKDIENRLETVSNLNEPNTARVLKKKPPKTEIIYDKPPEDENPPEYPYINDPKMVTIGINTDISSPSIFMKQYKVNEGNDVKMIKPMLIDASIVDSITAEKNTQDKTSAYQEFNRRVNNHKQQKDRAEESDSNSDSENEDDNQNNNYYEDTKNFYKAPKETKAGGKGKTIRMLN